MHAELKQTTREASTWRAAQQAAVAKVGAMQRSLEAVRTELWEVQANLGAKFANKISHLHRHVWEASTLWPARDVCAGCPAERDSRHATAA